MKKAGSWLQQDPATGLTSTHFDGKLLLTLNQMYAINCYWEIYVRW